MDNPDSDGGFIVKEEEYIAVSPASSFELYNGEEEEDGMDQDRKKEQEASAAQVVQDNEIDTLNEELAAVDVQMNDQSTPHNNEKNNLNDNNHPQSSDRLIEIAETAPSSINYYDLLRMFRELQEKCNALEQFKLNQAAICQTEREAMREKYSQMKHQNDCLRHQMMALQKFKGENFQSQQILHEQIRALRSEKAEALAAVETEMEAMTKALNETQQTMNDIISDNKALKEEESKLVKKIDGLEIIHAVYNNFSTKCTCGAATPLNTPACRGVKKVPEAEFTYNDYLELGKYSKRMKYVIHQKQVENSALKKRVEDLELQMVEQKSADDNAISIMLMTQEFKEKELSDLRAEREKLLLDNAAKEKEIESLMKNQNMDEKITKRRSNDSKETPVVEPIFFSNEEIRDFCPSTELRSIKLPTQQPTQKPIQRPLKPGQFIFEYEKCNDLVNEYLERCSNSLSTEKLGQKILEAFLNCAVECRDRGVEIGKLRAAITAAEQKPAVVKRVVEPEAHPTSVSSPAASVSSSAIKHETPATPSSPMKTTNEQFYQAMMSSQQAAIHKLTDMMANCMMAPQQLAVGQTTRPVETTNPQDEVDWTQVPVPQNWPKRRKMSKQSQEGSEASVLITESEVLYCLKNNRLDWNGFFSCNMVALTRVHEYITDIITPLKPARLSVVSVVQNLMMNEEILMGLRKIYKEELEKRVQDIKSGESTFVLRMKANSALTGLASPSANALDQMSPEMRKLLNCESMSITQEDADIVYYHTHCTMSQALTALVKCNGNVIQAIIDLTV